MASVTASDWKNEMNLPDGKISDTNAEYVLNGAINILNTLGADLSNMSGAAGSKTVTLTSKQQGGVFHAARIIYFSYYKEIETANTGNVVVSSSDLMSNPVVWKQLETIAGRLEAKGDIPLVVAEDTTGYT